MMSAGSAWIAQEGWPRAIEGDFRRHETCDGPVVRPSLALLFLVACSAAPPTVGDGDAPDDAGMIDTTDATDDLPDTPPASDASADDAAPDPCKKHLTVVFAVGTGTNALRSHATSCYTVLDADGAATKSFRKCSTTSWTVVNASAPSWAYDDTNPNHDLAQEKAFIQKCAAGATGVGFEYMAYRGGWRILTPENRLKALFAELHAGDGDIDDNWPSHWVNDAQLRKHTRVYPMINIGPTNVSNPAPTIEHDALALCKTIRDGGYFGVYVGTWNQPMTAGDPRIVAMANALDTCTKN